MEDIYPQLGASVRQPTQHVCQRNQEFKCFASKESKESTFFRLLPRGQTLRRWGVKKKSAANADVTPKHISSCQIDLKSVLFLGPCKCVSFFENHWLTKRWFLTGLWGRVVPCLVPGVSSSSAVNVGRNFWLYVRYFIFISFPGYCCSSIQLIWLFFFLAF